jgi:hypothetical protein
VSMFGPRHSYCQALEISACLSLDLDKANVGPWKSLGAFVSQTTSPQHESPPTFTCRLVCASQKVDGIAESV